MKRRLTNLLHRVLGGRREPPVAGTASVVDYKGYLIRPLPRVLGSEWTTEGVISKQFTSGLKEYHFIRVDTHGEKDEATTFCIAKAKQIIDEQGFRMFSGDEGVDS